MPKLKTKSSAKKRFRLTAKGKVKMAQAGKMVPTCPMLKNQLVATPCRVHGK